MRRLLCSAVAVGFVLAVGCTGAAAEPNTAAGSGKTPLPPATARAVWSNPVHGVLSTLQSSAQLRMEIDQLTPRVVKADGPPEVTISGKVTNVGENRISDLTLRLERGDPVPDENALRTALREPAADDVVHSVWVSIAPVLQRGQEAPFTLTVPLTGEPGPTLAVDKPGIYPLLANINGTPDYNNGHAAQLATLSTLLPVLGLPGGTPVKPATPAKLTVLWPLVDQPRLVRAGPDGEAVLTAKATQATKSTPGDQAILTDDTLPGLLTLGGRLNNLLAEYESRASATAAYSLCLAIDPELLQTVYAMSKGYQVAGGAQGRGQDIAKRWLDRLTLAARGHCVLALPYADADLVALTRAGLGDLTKFALDASAVVQNILEVQPLTNLAWPYGGVLDDKTTAELADRGVTTVLLDPKGLTGAPGAGPVRLDRAGGATTTAVRTDQLVSDALGNPGQPTPANRTSASADTKAVSVQNALAALVLQTGFEGSGQNLVVTPPRTWDAPAGELKVFLDTVQSLFDSQAATATPLQDLAPAAGAPAPQQGATLNYPAQAASNEIPKAITDDVRAARDVVAGLADSMTQEDRNGATPASVTNPLREGLLRVTANSWRGNDGAARAALTSAQNQIGAVQAAVAVVQPENTYSMGSGNAPVPVTVANKLPVQVRARVVFDDAAGFRQKSVEDWNLPAGASRVVLVPIEVLRSGRLSINVRVTTPGGVPLGADAARLEISSSASGTIVLIITVVAGAVLVLLVGRRLYRRIRGGRTSTQPGVGESASQQDNGPAEPPEKSAQGVGTHTLGAGEERSGGR
ncbi:hypothetical protein F0L68_37600 [Solihabitans fulvus]|uniref:Glycoprotein n=1 Tax=Solihabitans fulvus TaxID=1892852 RepID=A0A5B2WKY0_9PSEU|nr:DUF6049 family protein [Solihabitans fulvus]KAA2251342.1 hypothetical protein F0L68_37600 [Solihabitans fulvus]